MFEVKGGFSVADICGPTITINDAVQSLYDNMMFMGGVTISLLIIILVVMIFRK